MDNSDRKHITILGSTGSVGRQALDVIKAYPELYKVHVLTAGKNARLLIEQAKLFEPDIVVIANESAYAEVAQALRKTDITVLAGATALNEVAEMPEVDIVLAAIAGFSGLLPVVAAIKAGKTIALANKEPLVVAGSFLMELSRKHHATLLPVDSEHSAIFQCLVGEDISTVDRIYLTASGGPFVGRDLTFLSHVKPEEALRHPNWSMGRKITVDSASLMNKGLEVIEAKWLFDLQPDQIKVLVHPQSVVHSMVQFIDGAIKSQLGAADMKLPIQYAFTYPKRMAGNVERVNFLNCPELSFYEPDIKVFKNLTLAYKALEYGGIMPCVLNAASEIVVEAFLNYQIGFTAMSEVIETVLEKTVQIQQPGLDDYVSVDREARILTNEAILHLI